MHNPSTRNVVTLMGEARDLAASGFVRAAVGVFGVTMVVLGLRAQAGPGVIPHRPG